MKIACLVTTYNRPDALARSLPQIVALGAPVLVVDDGSSRLSGIEVDMAGVDWLYMPSNRGLAAALNIGLSYWLADKSITHISYFQDDVDVRPETLKVLSLHQGRHPLVTGHDAPEHKAHRQRLRDGLPLMLYKHSIRATHMHGSVGFWRSVMPIPTNELGTPKRNGSGRGIGSDVDWWIVRDAPCSIQKTKQEILCVPGLVRSFLCHAADSCWNNESRGGEEPPLRAEWPS